MSQAVRCRTAQQMRGAYGCDGCDGCGWLQVPLVVRLEGTNVEEGKRILRESAMDLIPADDLDDAATKAVAAISA